MKKTIKSRIKKRYDQAGEDMRILQHMIHKQSVYAKVRAKSFTQRRPKHVKRYLEIYQQGYF